MTCKGRCGWFCRCYNIFSGEAPETVHRPKFYLFLRNFAERGSFRYKACEFASTIFVRITDYSCRDVCDRNNIGGI